MKECITALRCHADPDLTCSQCPYRKYAACFAMALRGTIEYVDELEEKYNKVILDHEQIAYERGVNDGYAKAIEEMEPANE